MSDRNWIKRTDRNPTADDTDDRGWIAMWHPGLKEPHFKQLAFWFMSPEYTHFLCLEKTPPLPVTYDDRDNVSDAQCADAWKLVWNLLTSLPVFQDQAVSSAPTGREAALNAIRLLAEDSARLNWLEDTEVAFDNSDGGHLKINGHHFYAIGRRALIDSARRFHS